MTAAPQLIFIDASVFIAAAASESGGSALVLEICRGSRYKALCSQRVLVEAQTNLRGKFTDDALARFYRLLAALSPMIAPPAAPSDEAAYLGLTSEKDAHVIASAVLGGAAYLIRLDRRHLVNDAMRSAGLPFQVLLPGEFIRIALSAG